MKKELLQYVSVAKFLKDALGERYRVSLIDADNLGCQIIISEQGISENKIDAVTETEILSDILNSKELKKRDYLCSFFESEENTAGEKNSVFYIRNENGEISGFLCIYEKRGDIDMVREVLDEVLLSEERASEERAVGGSERIRAEVSALLKERIVEVWNRHKNPDGKMKKAEKIAFISELFEMGIFRMKGAAAQVSEVTGISQASLYRYLSEVLEE